MAPPNQKPYTFALVAVRQPIMRSSTSKLTVRLPTRSLETAKRYAKEHGLTVTEVIDRYLRALREVGTEPGEEVRSITGLIPADLDAAAEYRRFLSQKHSR